jgi:hypothetical protein
MKQLKNKSDILCFFQSKILLISTSKNAMCFLLLLISTLQWNWRKSQNRFCLEERQGKMVGAGDWGEK